MSIRRVNEGNDHGLCMSVLKDALFLNDDVEFRRDFIIKNKWHSFVSLALMDWEEVQQLCIASAEFDIEKALAITIFKAELERSDEVKVFSLDTSPEDIMEIENYEYGHFSLIFDAGIRYCLFRYYTDFSILSGVPEFIRKVGVSVDKMHREYERELDLMESPFENLKNLRSRLDGYFIGLSTV